MLYGVAEELFTEKSSFRQPLDLYGNNLGVHTVNLKPTILEISRAGNLSEFPLKASPYFQKVFGNKGDERSSAAKELLQSKNIFEFTVFPNGRDYKPSNIIEKMEIETGKSFSIKKDHSGLRGTVRILTDDKKNRYIYTFDHYKKFYGPWKLNGAGLSKKEKVRIKKREVASNKYH